MNTLESDDFNYAVLPPDAEHLLRQSADRIRNIIRKRLADYVEIGRIFLRAKIGLEPGTFLNWVQAATSMPYEQARKYMKIAKAFGSRDNLIWEVPFAVAVALSRLADYPSLLEEVLHDLENGEELTANEINELRARFLASPETFDLWKAERKEARTKGATSRGPQSPTESEPVPTDNDTSPEGNPQVPPTNPVIEDRQRILFLHRPTLAWNAVPKPVQDEFLQIILKHREERARFEALDATKYSETTPDPNLTSGEAPVSEAHGAAEADEILKAGEWIDSAVETLRQVEEVDAITPG